MALFEFELARVEDIVPWESEGVQVLSWFALTDGRFRMPVGRHVLFEYTDEILSHWQATGKNAEYQVAAFARDILGSVGPGLARLPEGVERLASNWELLRDLDARSQAADDATEDRDDDYEPADDPHYLAWRWLGERSPCTSYLSMSPDFQFIRVGDELRIHWDNRACLVDGLPVWTASHGVYVLPAQTFLEEARDFAHGLLAAMQQRIASMEGGISRPQVAVDAMKLREQHGTWCAEFAKYFGERESEPDIPWSKTEHALRAIAKRHGVIF
jgi:hypothetical protein